MGSSWGARNGPPGYDEFRTGLKFADVKSWARSESEDPKDWRYSRRATVLGMWHQHKLELYEQAVARGLLDHQASGVDGMASKRRGVRNVRPSDGDIGRRSGARTHRADGVGVPATTGRPRRTRKARQDANVR